MTTAPTKGLIEQIKERLRTRASSPVNAKIEPVPTVVEEETREQYEKRITETPEAWQDVTGHQRGILPR